MADTGEAQVDPARLSSRSGPVPWLRTFTPDRVLVTPGLSLLGLHYHSLPGQPTGLKVVGTKDWKSCAVQGLLVVGQGKAQNVFTFSFLSFWWPRWLAVTPLRFLGPRECLHYITPDTTAP